MKINKYIVNMMMAVALCAAASSCDKEDDSDIILAGSGKKPTPSTGDDEPNSSDTTSVIPLKYAARMEVPAFKSGNLFIQHSTKVGNDSVMNYCLEYDTKANHSRWVAFRFDSKTRVQATSRQDNFIDDPSLPSQYWIGESGFGNGYDRGHLCASADRLYSKEANLQTFYMTNMSPQMSSFNQDYWICYEAKVQSWGRSSSFADTLYVVKGGTIDRTLGTRSRNNNRQVVIPKYYFMALLKCKNNVYTGLAFLMEHKNYGMTDIPNSEMAAHAVTIDELEEFTGIDFFPNLPDSQEEKVESSISLSAWNLAN